MTAEQLAYGLPVTVRLLNRNATELEVTGDRLIVDEWWTEYCKQYHPNGYGTMICSDETVESFLPLCENKLSRMIRTFRGSTCD